MTAAWWIAAASAFDASGDCPSPVEAVLPLPGDVGVPRDVLPVLFHANPCASLPSASLLDDATGTPVPTTVEPVAAAVVRLVPDELLEPGRSYTITDPADGGASSFTVGRGAAIVPPEPVVEGEFGATCGAFTTLSAYLRGSFPDADPAGRGLLWLHASVDGTRTVLGPELYEGQVELELPVELLGGRQLCTSFAFDDLAGVRAWETDEICGDEFVCPSERQGRGCGCATGGGAGFAGLLAVALLARRSR